MRHTPDKEVKRIRNYGKGELYTGLVLVAIVVFFSILSLFWTPYDINYMDTANRLSAPSLTHLFGTDNMGRDIFSRVIVGGRFTLTVAVLTVFSCTLIAIVLGMLSGYVGGAVDEIIMRCIDAVSSFPGILIALIFVTVLPTSNYTIVLALCIMFVPSFTRIVRTGTLQYKNTEFIKSCRIFGDSPVRLLLVHILPNILPQLLSSIVIGLSNAILAESSMSYLGLCIQPPAPSWGRMLSEAQNYIFKAPWTALAPGLMIVITIIGFNCIGEGIRKRRDEIFG